LSHYHFVCPVNLQQDFVPLVILDLAIVASGARLNTYHFQLDNDAPHVLFIFGYLSSCQFIYEQWQYLSIFTFGKGTTVKLS